MPPPTTTTTTTRRATRTKITTTTNELATKLESALTICETSSKAKQRVRGGTQRASPATPEDERVGSMRIVNTSLRTLSAVTQSGWKAVPEAKTSNNANAAKVDGAVKAATKALECLRVVSPDDLDVERAACSIAGKLLTLEMYNEATSILDGMHPRLLRFATFADTEVPRPPLPLHLLSLPKPTSEDPIVLTLMITTLTHTLNALIFLLLRPSSPFSASAFVAALHQAHSFLAWTPYLKPTNIPAKTRDALLTKVYTAFTKACTLLSSGTGANSDPKSVFCLRIYALSCLLYTAPGTIKPATFWDQVQKACLSYARASPSSSNFRDESKDSETAACVSDRLYELIRRAQGLDSREFVEGRPFVQMCEMWMSFAKKGGDMAVLDNISELMGLFPTTPSPSSSRVPPLPIVTSTSSDLGPSPSPSSMDDLAAQVGSLKLDSESTKAEGTASKIPKPTRDTTLLQCAQCCAVFVKATASLESDSPDLSKHVKQATDALRRYCSLVALLDSFTSVGSPSPNPLPDTASNYTSSTDADVLRARGKMERALERLRRAALRLLEPQQQTEKKDPRASVISLLEAIANTLEDSSRQPMQGSKEILTSLLDVLFVLARIRLNCADVDSYTPALHYLKRASAAVVSVSTPTLTAVDAATLLRCTSGALHNLGGALYTAGRYGGAVRFLKEGCNVGRRAMALRFSISRGEDKVNEDVESDRDKEGWKQLEEQLYRRYELLGVCHSKIGDRKLAYEAFVESVRTFPYTHYAPVFSSVDAFGSTATPPLKQLTSTIERLTYTGTCELLLAPAQISLRHVLEVSGPSSAIQPHPDNALTVLPITTLPTDAQSQADITGAILARQLNILEGLAHKEGVREAMGHILQDLLDIYDGSVAPVKRAGVLVTALGVSWRDGGGEDPQWDAEIIGKEALVLLALEEHASDRSLAALIPQLTFSVHLWMALHAYRRSSSGTNMASAVAVQIEGACQVLNAFLPGPSSGAAGEASPKTKRAGGSGSGAKVTKSSARTVKKGRSAGGAASKSSRKAAVNTVTPRPRKALEAVSLNTAEVTPPKPSAEAKKAAPAFDLQPVLGLIQMNVHLVGLLGLIVLKVKLLEVLRSLCEHQTPVPVEAYSVICVDLAHEYIKLGKSKRAGLLFVKCGSMLKACEVPDEVRLRYLLGHAEVLALGDNVPASASSYCEAQSLEAVVALEEKAMTTTQRIRARVERLERAAMACRVFAAVQYSKDNVVGAMCSMLQSLRLWNRAVDALSRLSPPSSSAAKPSQEDSNPFEVPVKDSTNDQPSSSSPSRSTPSPTDALSWRLLSSLISTLFSLAQAYFARGSPREALYFIQQALDLAETTRAPTVVARALVMRGEVLLGQGELKEGKDALGRAVQLLGSTPGIDTADAERLKGDYGVLCEGQAEGDDEDPRESYERAWRMLDELEGMFLAVDGGRRKSSLGTAPNSAVVNAGQGMVVPRLLSTILRRHIWLLRNDEAGVLKDLVDRLMALPPSAEIKGEEHAIMGKLTMYSVYEQFRSDMFLSSLTESTIALPMGMSGDKDLSLVPATQDILNLLGDSENFFWADLALTSRRGAVPHVREASVSLAMIRALQSSLGKTSSDGPLIAARLIDASSAITLHREMLEAIQHKFLDMNTADDLQWRLMTPNGSPLPLNADTRTNPRHRNPSSSSLPSSSDSDDTDSPPTTLQSYWSALEKKYTSLVLSPSALSDPSPKFPHNWTVIHITLTPDKSTMFVSRLHTPSSQPLLFCVPLRGRRDADADADDESYLTLNDALHELREIVRLSDEGTRRAVHVRNDDPQARAGWWAERAALDKRLGALLENIEFCWLGAFKTVLSPPTTYSPEVINDLRSRLEKVFMRSLPPQDKKKSKLRLDDALLTCFSSLSPKCRDEELEDLVYFVLDLYQFHGVPVAISEVDVDQVTVDLRTALEEHAAVRKKGKITPIDDSHTFLVLDRNLQGIPWESIPALRGQSVSRIPSLEFLLDRLHLAEWQRKANAQRKNHTDEEAPVDRIHVDPRKTYYVLNPSGDLKGTEGRFASWLKEMHDVGWEGITGRAPSEQQFLNALSRKDLVIYFGHGGGEQYARSHKIRHLPRCAATMLWGCSSGALKEMGEFDRVGTPYNYMLAGCPTLVANLWDVTDRDIDKFTQGVFDQLRLTPGDVRRSGSGDGETSVVAAVAQSRQSCKLKYLTGAAPVVYGIPFYL
ncbi:hypothetical protein HYDPIDRAFT_32659 [Hydnomerulius pinastri MD-312]|uniref:separase n=1 Tax=Hydnomerulius pinastri MD-312 TaxID=994086 RepID=A0A0C9V3K4_9AGAM|nr:hypothetical protein HYDPIDRAFT_32659 [Hydnomerulius pinastri MD-312]